MAKTNIAQLPAKLYELLSRLSSEERARVVQATMVLFGDDPSATTLTGGDAASGAAAGVGTTAQGAQAFLDQKHPRNKGEMLAVVARYRELVEKTDTHSKADFKRVITSARRNFDDSNFTRDINNAKRQAGFFNTGTGRDASKLSYYGQQFVDALPNRDAVGKLKRPRVGGGKKKHKKRAKKQ